MSPLVRSRSLFLAVLGVCSAIFPLSAWATGSGLNTVVVVNQNSTNSLELGNYYCASRQVPPDNLLRISWPGPNTVWSSSDFQTNLLNPLLAMLAARQLTNQVDYLVLSMDIPFQTLFGTSYNSTTAALFYGLKPDTNGVQGYANSYAGSEKIFRLAQPTSAPGYSFLATMVTGNSLAQAEQLVDQGTSSDGDFPNQPVLLEKTPDPARNIRYSQFDNAIFNTRVLGRSSLFRTNSDLTPTPPPVLLGYQTGLANFSVAPGTFAPGAMADSLTSYGGLIFGSNDQTSLLAFIAAGAAGSYGTVAEPSSDPQKFPNSLDYFYQARGFSLAEAYYQSLYDPFLGLIVGEPLAAPFAQSGSGRWLGVASNAVLHGVSQLTVSFSARKPSAPVQQIDLFVDGKFLQTLTNVAPTPGNQLTLTLEGYPLTYSVPSNATLATMATGLVALVNTPAISNVTKIKAVAFGDRVELRSMSTNLQAEPFYYLDSTATNGTSFYAAAYLPYPIVPQMTFMGLDHNSNTLRIHLETTPGVPQVVLASTNLSNWLPIFTNLAGGEYDFLDPAGLSFPRRFYRLGAPDQRPSLSLAANPQNGSFKLHVQTQTAVPYTVQVSSNFNDWTVIGTNTTGASMDLTDAPPPGVAGRSYRAMLTPSAPPPANVAVLPAPPAGGNLVSVAGAARAYRLLASTNQVQWTALYTNMFLSPGQVTASASAGSANTLSTFLTASQPALLESTACGLRLFSMAGTPQTNTWLQLVVTKTNGFTAWFDVTNQTGTATLADMAQQIFNEVNADPDLQGPDGVVAEDFAVDGTGSPSFHLRALSPGYKAAAALRASLTASSPLGLSPYGPVSLNQNISDLQPRNHVYLTAGATTLATTFSLDTTLLPDGFHELTAVAYEGSHVRTQTRVILPVTIQNSLLTATLTLLDLTNNAPVQATYHVQVAATTNTVNRVSLFSNGGLVATATNQSTATFSVNGAMLGAGSLPFYALVQTSDGLTYRTPPRRVRLVHGP
jgi:uncharacterized protein (TIGR03790 family)